MKSAAIERYISYCKTLTIMLCAVGFHCISMGPSETSSSGGTGSEIVGTAAYDSSTAGKIGALTAVHAALFIPVVSGNVFCFQRIAVPDTNWARSGAPPRAYTDSAGCFTIYDAPPGMVVVEANDGRGNAVVDTVNVNRDSATYRMGVLAVKKTGAVTIQAQTQLSGRVRFYVGVMGTRLVVRGSQTAIEVKLDNIPCGIPHTICVRVYEPAYYKLDITDVSVVPGVVQSLGSFEIK